MKKRWLVVLLALAVILIGAALYFGAGLGQPETDYDRYNKALLAHLEGKTEESLAQFAYIAANTDDSWLKSLAFSQLGYIVGRQSFDERLTAIERYKIAQYSIGMLEKAVLHNPDNREAKYNLELMINQLPDLLEDLRKEGNSSGNKPGAKPDYGHGSGQGGY